MKQTNEVALENAATDREAALADLEATHYSKGAEALYLNSTTMQSAAKEKREYEFKDRIAEQEKLEATKGEINNDYPIWMYLKLIVLCFFNRLSGIKTYDRDNYPNVFFFD